MQGNPLWSLEVRADFSQLGLELALLIAIFFSKVMMSRLGKTNFKQIIVRHDVSPDLQDLKKLFR